MFLLTVLKPCFFCGSYLLVMLHVGVCFTMVSVSCCLMVTCWESADLLTVVFCHFPKCVLVHIRIMGEVGAIKTGLSPPAKYFTDCSKAVLLFCLLFAMPLCASVYMCLVVTCCEGLTSRLWFVVSTCEFVTFLLVSWVRCGT